MGESVVLDMIEGSWVAQGLEESCPVLEMGLHVGHLRVEDVRQGALPQEDLTHHPHTLCVFVACPHSSEPHHCRQGSLQFGQFFGNTLVGSSSGATDGPKDTFVALHEGNYGLPVVLGDVLSLVAVRGTSPLPPAANRPGSFLIPFAHHATLDQDWRTLRTREVAGPERSLKIVRGVQYCEGEKRADGGSESSDAA